MVCKNTKPGKKIQFGYILILQVLHHEMELYGIYQASGHCGSMRWSSMEYIKLLCFLKILMNSADKRMSLTNLTSGPSLGEISNCTAR